MKTDQSRKSYLLDILHLADPTLPIGGFSHSNGLETYVQQGLVKNVETTNAFLTSMLGNNYKYNDALFVRLAHELTLAKDFETVLDLDAECHALKAPQEIREGSFKLGIRLLKIYTQITSNKNLEKFYLKIRNGSTKGHYAVVYGAIMAELGVPLDEAVRSFYYNAAVSMVTNAVKLVPLGQIDGQKILYSLHAYIETLTQETLVLDRELLGMCNPALDVRCMQHEHLYSRLYMS